MRKRELERQIRELLEAVTAVSENLAAALQVIGHHFEAHETCRCARDSWPTDIGELEGIPTQS